ncbi:tRNA (adenosine(37)-N6)-threonylcarbamoyltransferase complex dimerization subunit type 1 TsaB [Gordonia lacunae]|uniref:tRNA (Adenosine(37)-N6)-threonylcarbamoyltransferase complex dimerization subunit type 1 TsaB n=1 Tax=Gordonia lacunae TaxID=417102 RepID=A0A243QCG8_9ACTN|nr:tRNA (adenosine(37)-N6)-threonylcarbamoyltransferase complex dimerization subunit type 1 TsaB [Gordonia lacunae]OUC78516.1 tRNA (adenosine(37)-N6)-threonylcarbamoyltransferase complex dimerization subunit type 1 TsaB [Gordonia lacunae]
MSDGLVLAVDTATDSVVAGVAALHAGEVRVLAERAVADHRRHAELLTTLIAESLTESGTARTDLTAVVVGCGPGPFTGLRVGMATGAAFADALGIPAYGVCSLDALAAEADRDVVDAGSRTLVVTDARRREVYWALYEGGRRLRGPEVAAPAVVAEELAPDWSAGRIRVVAGSAAHLESAGWTGAAPAIAVPTVRGLTAAAAAGIGAGRMPEPLVPLYLRRPDAVEQKDRRAGAAR